MAKKRRSELAPPELRAEIAASRDRLARDLSGLRYELDFPRKLRDSFQRHAGLWISATVLTGVVLVARSFPKQKIVYTTKAKVDRIAAEETKKGIFKAGLAMGALRFAGVVLRPVVIRFFTRQIGNYVSRSGRRRGW